MTEASLTRLSLRDLLQNRPPDVQYVVEGIASPGNLTLLYAEEKLGKSWLCKAFGTMMARGGGLVGGLDVASGACMYFDAENGEQLIAKRLWSLGLRADSDAVDRYHPYEVRGFDLRTDVHLLRKEIDDRRPSLLIIDSFRSSWGGKENESDETSAVLEQLAAVARDTGVAIILIHHSGKGAVGSQGYRGSGAIGSTVDIKVCVTRAESDPDKDRRRIHVIPRIDEERTVWVRFDWTDDGLRVLEADPFTGDDEEDDRRKPGPTRDPRRLIEVLGVLAAGPLSQADVCRAMQRDKTDATIRGDLKWLYENESVDRTPEGLWSRAPHNPTTPQPSNVIPLEGAAA